MSIWSSHSIKISEQRLKNIEIYHAGLACYYRLKKYWSPFSTEGQRNYDRLVNVEILRDIDTDHFFFVMIKKTEKSFLIKKTEKSFLNIVLDYV